MKNKYLTSVKSSVWLFLLLFLLHAVVYMTKTMFSAAMATIVEEGVMTKSQTGAISAWFWFIYAAFQIIGGFATDKYSPFKLITIGLVSGIISNLIIYLNNSYWVILVVWCINAALQFGLWPGIFKIVTTNLHPDVRSRAIFWVLLSTNAGQALSMIVASYVSGWKQNFAVSFTSLLVILILWVVVYKWLEKDMTGEEIINSPEDGTGKSQYDMKKLTVASGLIFICIAWFILVSVNNGVKMLTPVMLMETYSNLPGAISTRLSVIIIIFSVFGTFSANFVRNKVTSNEIKGATMMILIALPGLVLSYFLGSFHYIAILLLLAISTMFMTGASPFLASFSAARFTCYNRGGTVSGILNAAGSMGNVFASYFFAKMSEIMPWTYIVISWIVLILISIIICISLIRRWNNFTQNNVNL